MSKRYTSGRVVFRIKGKQKKFLDTAVKKLGGIGPLSKYVGLSTRTIRDWRREKFSMDLSSFNEICNALNTHVSLKEVELKDRYWYTFKGGVIGGNATYNKYGQIGGNEEKRRLKWKEWWDREGKKKASWTRISKPKAFKAPSYSNDLAEFIGIMLGDGGISKYQLSITLHSIDDEEYREFVKTLVERLFEVPVGIYRNKMDKAVDLVVSRTALVKFCTDKLGLKIGNKVKQQVDIPKWVKESKQYSIACARGLVDTDGSVFTHRYKASGKTYQYKKLSFTSRSSPLRRSMFEILHSVGLNPRLANDGIWIDSKECMKMYFALVGSHNPKHLKRYKN
jgi:hypothetical protein